MIQCLSLGFLSLSCYFFLKRLKCLKLFIFLCLYQHIMPFFFGHCLSIRWLELEKSDFVLAQNTSIRRQAINLHMCLCFSLLRLPQHSDGKESACNGGDLGSIPAEEDPLEKGMSSHSHILAWQIPWTEESGGLQFMGSQRVGHN